MRPAASKAWLVLGAGGLVEVIWAAALRRAAGGAHPDWLVAALALSVVSVAMLGWAMQRITLGAGYAAWIGIGTAGSVAAGIVVFGEPASTGRLLSIACVLVAIVGLRLTEPGGREPPRA